MTPPRVRFAPSPTGFLHVGGARTALFNWLLARGQGGVFVLRIEDTDRERSSDEMTQAILDGLDWLGLDWDEGPFHQADGLHRHTADAQRLLKAGALYRCFCTPEELAERRREAGDSYRYDRRCLGIAPRDAEQRAEAGEPFTLRFQVPPGTTSWEDGVHGTLSFSNADIEDFIVVRSDGTPIYNLAVVSDDVAMRISHVIRGDDHISNTPKQILIYDALGAEVPTFVHVPMILGPDGKRLSKRHGATAVGEYRHQGILPDAMVNFLALLGWSPGDDREIFSRDELIQAFSIAAINKKSAVFDARKLEWLNGQHLNALPGERLEAMVTEALDAAGLVVPDRRRADAGWFGRLVELLKARARTVDDIVQQARPYLMDDVEYDTAAVAKHWRDAGPTAERLAALRERLADVDWHEEALERELRACAESLGVGAGKLIHPLRVALTGVAVSPGIFEVMVVIGREQVLARMDRAIEALGALAE